MGTGLRIAVGGTAVLFSLLLGCGPAGEEPVAQAYGDAVRELGIFPVFPPREEFQVGDIYFWSQSTSDPSDTISVYIDTMDWVREDASRFMLSRIVFTETDTDPAAQDAGEAADLYSDAGLLTRRQDLTGDDRSVLTSLPIAAFPSITADAGFAGGLSVADALSAVGLGGGGRTQLTLNFNDVRTYWVPKSRISSRVAEVFALVAGPKRQFAVAEARRSLLTRHDGSSADPCGNGRHCGFSVITRVYLTRRIDYTYRNALIVAAGLRRAEAQADPSAPAPASQPAAPAVVVSVSTDADGSVDTTQTQQQLDALQQKINTLAGSQSPGQSLSFSSWDALGITFSRNYQRPVAIGWDGFDLNLPPS